METSMVPFACVDQISFWEEQMSSLTSLFAGGLGSPSHFEMNPFWGKFIHVLNPNFPIFDKSALT